MDIFKEEIVNLQTLPEDIIYQICLYLNTKDLHNFITINCKILYKLRKGQKLVKLYLIKFYNIYNRLDSAKVLVIRLPKFNI